MADTSGLWHLAQVNVGRLAAPRGHPSVAPFFDALDRVNALADASPGFVWRLQDEGGNATDIGAAPEAFTFKARFPAPGARGGPVDMQPDPWCVGRA